MYYDGDTFEHNGKTFKVNFPYDDSSDAPWEREDGHGEVSDWTSRDKKAGERVLCSDRGSKRYYDYAAAIRTAKAECWDAPPYKTGTKGEQAVRAVEADFDRLQRWCNDDWCYIGVVVTLLDDDGEETEHSNSLWGIESDCSDYIEEVVIECADIVLAELGD